MRAITRTKDDILRAGRVVADLRQVSMGMIFELAWAVELAVPITLTLLDGSTERLDPPHDETRLDELLREAGLARVARVANETGDDLRRLGVVQP